eukprot:3056981-Karenia_brevis.AAC.1
MKGPLGSLQIVNIHVEPLCSISERIESLTKLRKAIGNTSSCRVVMAGDFNFVLDDADRYHPESKSFTG